MTLLRKTTQFVLPVEKPETGVNQYDIYPAHDLGEEKIFCDYMSLARRIAGSKRVIIDGYVGVRFDIFSRELNKALETLGIRPVWWNAGAAMKEPAEIDRLIEPYLGGDDPIFGFRTPLRLEEFFDREKLDRIRPDDAAQMNILIGIGRFACRLGRLAALYRHSEERDSVPLAGRQHHESGSRCGRCAEEDVQAFLLRGLGGAQPS